VLHYVTVLVWTGPKISLPLLHYLCWRWSKRGGSAWMDDRTG